MKVLLPRQWVLRHWRGLLPLPLSFWAVGSLGIVFVLLLGYLTKHIFFASYNPYLDLVGLIAEYVASFATLTWWLVGTWRSATLRALHIPGNVWPKVVKVAMGLIIVREVFLIPSAVLPIFNEAISDIREDPQFGPRGVRMGPTTEVEIYGAITRSVPLALEEAIKSNPKISVVRLSSKGGRAGAAYELRDRIRNHGLDTLVSTECSSYCVIVFLGGKHRWMERSARMGFHRIQFGGQNASDANEIARREMKAAGISSNFLNKVFATPPESLWYPSNEELRDAGVVTGCPPDEQRTSQ